MSNNSFYTAVMNSVNFTILHILDTYSYTESMYILTVQSDILSVTCIIILFVTIKL
jgi:hypothetical protein